MSDPYDEIPFESQATPDRHIDRLAVTGSLFGITAASPNSSRVLEIGCSTGANLIPQALDCPHSEFFGIDLSAKQIAIAATTAELLKAANASFAVMDFKDAAYGNESFDYILCHGVYSWIAPALQGQLLECIGRWIKPNGAVLLTHNALPGWRYREQLRERLRLAGQGGGSALERIRAAREILEQINRSSIETADPEYAALRREAQVVLAHSDGYILHELLAPFGDATPLPDLVSAAGTAGLRYLADANPRRNRRLHERFHALTAPSNERLSAAEMEQRIDEAHPIPFRSSIFTRANPAAAPSIGADLFVSSPLVPVSNVRWEQGERQRAFIAPDESMVESEKPAVIRLLLSCAEVWPEARPVCAAAGVEAIDPDLQRALCALYFEGRLELHSRPPRCRREPAVPARAASYARVQSEQSAAVTTLRHEVVPLNPFERILIRALDGTRDGGALEAVMRRALHEGTISVDSKLHEQITAAQSTYLAEAIAQTIEHFREQGLLE